MSKGFDWAFLPQAQKGRKPLASNITLLAQTEASGFQLLHPHCLHLSAQGLPNVALFRAIPNVHIVKDKYTYYDLHTYPTKTSEGCNLHTYIAGQANLTIYYTHAQCVGCTNVTEHVVCYGYTRISVHSGMEYTLSNIVGRPLTDRTT